MQSGARRSHRREQKAREAVARTNLDRQQVHPRRAASGFWLATAAVARPWRRRHAQWSQSGGRTRPRREGGVWKLGIKEKTCLVFLQITPWIFLVWACRYQLTSVSLPPRHPVNHLTRNFPRPTSSAEHVRAVRPCLVSKNYPKIFNIHYHIESCGTCIEH